jgi:hypothetical protein
LDKGESYYDENITLFLQQGFFVRKRSGILPFSKIMCIDFIVTLNFSMIHLAKQ